MAGAGEFAIAHPGAMLVINPEPPSFQNARQELVDPQISSRQSSTKDSIEQMQFFSRLEADGASGHDRNFRASPWVASNSGFSGLDAEYAKPPQFNAISRGESVFHAGEDSIHGGLGFHAR